MGHDADAATVMGRLRSVLHGLALEGADPAEALAKLDAYLCALDADRFATCLYAIYHPESRRLRYAASGHLPPLLVRGEHTGYLEVPPALPLGLGSSPVDREVAVPPGAGLLLYTDGLVEHRTQPLEDGLTALYKACAALPTSRPPSAAHRPGPDPVRHPRPSRRRHRSARRRHRTVCVGVGMGFFAGSR